MSTFIVPLDGSEAGHDALRLGHAIAESVGAELGVVLVNGASQKSAGSLPEHVAAGVSNDTPVRLFALTTSPGRDFLTWISELAQPVVVLDRPGPTSSVTDWIVQHAGPSVTTLTGTRGVTGLRLERIMVPLDGTEAAEQALPLAARLAERSDAVLSLVQIVPPNHELDSEITLARIEQVRDAARAYLDRVARKLRTDGIAVSWEVRIGAPGEEIARAAETTATDLIVMASRNYTTLTRQAAGVTTLAIEASTVPIIVSHIEDNPLP